MSRRLLCPFMVALLVVCLAQMNPLSKPAQAQTDSTGWRVVLYDPALQEIWTVTPDGIESFITSIPFQTFRIIAASNTDQPQHYVVINGDFVAGYYPTGESGPSEIVVGNIADADNCCVRVANHFLEEYLPEGAVIQEEGIAGISPDGQVVAVYYVAELATPGNINYTTHSAIGLIDVASCETIAYSLISDNTLNAAPRFFHWDEAGLHFQVECHLCTHGIQIFETRILSATGDTVAVDGYADWAAVLPATNEVLAAGRSSEYPANEGEGPVPIPNVIRYRPSLAEDAVIVYHDAERFLHMPDPVWVMDGQAFLVRRGPLTTVVYRDGRVDDLDTVPDTMFLVGTPDGWLSYRFTDGMVLHHTGPDAPAELGQITPDGVPVVLDATPLGSGQDFIPFGELQ